MSDIRKKLEALKQQHGLQSGADLEHTREASPPPPRPKSADRGMSVPTHAPRSQEPTPCEGEGSPQPQRLRSLLDRLHMVSGTDLYRQREAEEERREAGDFEVDRILGGEIVGDAEDGFFLLRRDYPLEHRQGSIELGTALESASHHIAFSAADPALQDFDPRKTLFVDTETIGLAGGTGTVAFLVGAGYFTGDGFRLDQCFMRDYDDEEPMLRYIAELLKGREALVSYNGKSFDLPLLRTRFIQNRLPFRGDGILHLDLVHVARRFWKRRLSDCSLGNIEREILGVHREGDVPSYLIPSMWFEYLRTRDARPLEGVFYHHRMDILSLAALTGWVSRCLEAPAGEGFFHSEDKLSVVRVYFLQRRYAEVIEHGRRFLELDAVSPMRCECLEMLGFAAKRLEQWEDMERYWERLVEEFPECLSAYLELAKHYEHRRRDLEHARDICRKALDVFREQNRSIVKAVYAQHDTEPIERRLMRIEKKLGRGAGGGELI